jgi:hypothetical protein
VAVLASGARAGAAPKTPKAKAAFAAGVKAYQKGNYGIAAKQLERSFALERDVETLFAWAQTERQLDHCDKATELYDKILTFDLPAENKAAVVAKRDECKALLDAMKPPPEQTVAPVIEPPTPTAMTEPPELAVAPTAGGAWWKDPVGLTTVGLGVVGGAIGAYYLIAGNSAHTEMVSFDGRDRAQYLHYKAEADTDGTRGVVATALGGGLIAVGIIWFATHRNHREGAVVSGWLAPGASGLALTGRF